MWKKAFLVTTVALCIDIESFAQGRILSREFAAKYPGGILWSLYARELEARGLKLATGDMALEGMRNGSIAPDQVLVCQDSESPQGARLIAMGAKPLQLFCLESPLFSRKFYWRFPTTARQFPHRVLFRGLLNSLVKTGSNHVAYFPSFERAHVRLRNSDPGSLFAAMITSNKYWRKRGSNLIVSAKDRFLNALVATRVGSFKSNQLHDRRLEMIEVLLDEPGFELWGGGWTDTSNLPRDFRNQIANRLTGKYKGQLNYEDKLNILQNYRFCFCIENYRLPGYITEKIFDALVAGSVPVYLGAPDVSEFVDSRVFVDANEFGSPSDLINYLRQMSDEEYTTMRNAGFEYLLSPKGDRHSHEYQASFMANLALQLAKC